MTCDRCYRSIEHGEHGLNLCPLEPRRAHTVRPDDIPGGVLIGHGLCNPDGTPRRYDSHSAITRACEQRGLVRWTDHYDESRTKDGRVYADWKQSSEAQQARRERHEARRMKGREY